MLHDRQVDSSFPLSSVPIVIALSGPATDNYEQEDENTNTDDEDDSIETLFNETQELHPQHASQ
jgi:hypothetical protein